MPSAPEREIGTGINGVTWEALSVKAFEKVTKVTGDALAPRERHRLCFVDSVREYARSRESDNAASASVQLPLGKMRALLSLSSNIAHRGSEQITTIIFYLEKSGFIEHIKTEELKLSHSARAVVKDPMQFRKYFGDYFIWGYGNCARFIASWYVIYDV